MLNVVFAFAAALIPTASFPLAVLALAVSFYAAITKRNLLAWLDVALAGFGFVPCLSDALAIIAWLE